MEQSGDGLRLWPEGETAAQSEDRLARAGSLKWAQYQGEIGAWVAEMDFELAQPIRSALDEALARGLTGYIPGWLRRQVQAACAGWSARRHDWAVDPEDVVVIPNVLHGLTTMMERFVPPGPVIVPVPAYMPFLTMPGESGREVIRLPMTQDAAGRPTMDLEGLDRAFAAGGTMLVLCNPHNPRGVALTEAEAVAIGQVVESHAGRVFADEIHGPLVLPGCRHRPYAQASPVNAGHTLTATAATKGWNFAGLPNAQLILSNDRDRALVAEHRHRVTEGASTLGLVATVAAYERGEAWLDAAVGQIADNLALLEGLVAEHLPGVRFRHGQEATFLAWLDFRNVDLAGEAPSVFLHREAQVATNDGATLGVPGCVRLNVALPPALLVEAVERMGRALARR
ncbi:MAG: aminotransferase class I/II-fold pyridoxal phosphate-dependent enzyme [Propionibacteriaceae bacterium]|nr:aminotransferase class I/II-fold pyridoxal phosphate-dependent enzyme [Propionibacteriaceae bacterium]